MAGDNPQEPASPLLPEDRDKVQQTRQKVREKMLPDGSESSGRGSGAGSGKKKASSKASEAFVERTPEELARIRSVVDKAFALMDLMGDPKATDAQKDQATSDYARESTMLVIEKWLPYVKYAEEINCGFSIVMYGGWRGYKFARTLLKGQGAQLSELKNLSDAAGVMLKQMGTAPAPKTPPAPPAATKPPDPPPTPMQTTIPEEP